MSLGFDAHEITVEIERLNDARTRAQMEGQWGLADSYARSQGFLHHALRLELRADALAKRRGRPPGVRRGLVIFWLAAVLFCVGVWFALIRFALSFL